jgi:signal peptidase I
MNRRKILCWTLTVLGLLILLPISTLAVLRPFYLPTRSMEPTLFQGDRFLVLNARLAGPFRRGDLVSFHYPVDPRQVFVKRIVGIPGDHIRFRDKQLFLNGRALREPYVLHTTDYIDSYRDNFPGEPNFHGFDSTRSMLANHVVDGELVVPPNNYFVLGDNRDASADSRYWGFVSQDKIMGRPVYVYSPAPGAKCRQIQRYQLQ